MLIISCGYLVSVNKTGIYYFSYKWELLCHLQRGRPPWSSSICLFVFGREEFKRLKCLHGKLAVFVVNSSQKSTCTWISVITGFCMRTKALWTLLNFGLFAAWSVLLVGVCAWTSAVSKNTSVLEWWVQRISTTSMGWLLFYTLFSLHRTVRIFIRVV